MEWNETGIHKMGSYKVEWNRIKQHRGKSNEMKEK